MSKIASATKRNTNAEEFNALKRAYTRGRKDVGLSDLSPNEYDNITHKVVHAELLHERKLIAYSNEEVNAIYREESASNFKSEQSRSTSKIARPKRVHFVDTLDLMELPTNLIQVGMQIYLPGNKNKGQGAWAVSFVNGRLVLSKPGNNGATHEVVLPLSNKCTVLVIRNDEAITIMRRALKKCGR